MNTLSNDHWLKLLPLLRERCPRLTEQDLAECEQRLDLLTAKIQNRHWIDRVAAQRVAVELLQRIGAMAPSAGA